MNFKAVIPKNRRKIRKNTARVFRAFAASTLVCTAVWLGGCSIFGEDISSYTAVSSKADDTTQITVTTDYAYDTLTSDACRELYVEIGESVQSLYPQSVSYDGKLDDYTIFQAIEAYKSDHPEVFWLKSADSYTSYGSLTEVSLTYTLEYDELESAREEFDAAVNEIVAAAPQSGAFAKEEYINNTIAERCTYDSAAAAANSILGSESDAYGALVLGKAVCEGYARAFQLLCNKLDIDCVMLSGTVDSGNHAWNCVKIGGEWYQTDVTWNDTDGEEEYSQNDYFNLTDSVMAVDHTLSPKYSDVTAEQYESLSVWCNFYVPTCTSTEYGYYSYKYPTVSLGDSGEAVSSAAAAAAKNGDKYFSIVLNTDDFEGMYNTLVNDGSLSEWIGEANEINSYLPTISETCYVYPKSRLNVLTIEMDYE